MKRTSKAEWSGPGKTGKGNVSTQSGVLSKNQYSFSSRFEEGIGTNPEELIAAAHAGCFSMKLSFILGAAGHEPASIATDCTITIENGTITNSDLNVNAKVPGITQESFEKCVEEAKITCPVSKVLNAEITVQSVLES